MSNGFAYTDNFGAACDQLASHPRTPESVQTYVRGVKHTSSQAGYVSSSQAYHIGKHFKLYVNNGVYIQHDWWD